MTKARTNADQTNAIDATPIGATTPSTGVFTTVRVANNTNGLLAAEGESSSAQLKLERTSTNAGVSYLGSDSSYLIRCYDQSLTHRFGWDRTGRMLLPYQPRFFAIRAGGSHQTTAGVVEFSGEQIDVGGWYNSGSYNAVAPVAGTYMFSVDVFWYLPNASSYAFGYFHKNGTAFGQVCHSSAASAILSYQPASYATMITLAQGDYVDFRMTGAVSSGGVYAGSYSSFKGQLIG